MGITGLLPALKTIQVTKHLSEFRGQTIAVDAYVWLHKGVYTCAAELATGKKTHRYVDYAMHRIRLLRHHGIGPYVVFDGGPLPAKRGTESDRKRKRDENLERANVLAAQGRHAQAWDLYKGSVDVTPEMAYQFIKALRAEGVSYVVAPFEADAQLAYLEKTGLVDGIITEDSDLLVFGCRKVLFKLDSTSNTVICISREDFGRATDSASGISLAGWSDAQFRAMAILSGCDYLPSIPGVGLKTACQLLRKWKTAKRVVDALTLEGKKPIPRDYWENYLLADKCFQHQRIFCPLDSKLDYLNQPGPEWTDKDEQYVGGIIDDACAKGIALGDINPVTLQPMVDINPDFRPPQLKPQRTLPNSMRLRKGKSPVKPTGGLFNFFGSSAKIAHNKPTSGGFSPHVKLTTATPGRGNTGEVATGKGSGKRTLADAMDQDRKAPKKTASPSGVLHSRFFSQSHCKSSQLQSPKIEEKNISRSTSLGSSMNAGPSRLKRQQEENKENVYILIDDSEDEEIQVHSKMKVMDCSMSLVGQRGDDSEDDGVEIAERWEFAKVDQEDGYISLGSSDDDRGDQAEYLSSPVRNGRTPKRRRRIASPNQPQRPAELLEYKDEVRPEPAPGGDNVSGDGNEDSDASVEVVSSPAAPRKRTMHRSQSLSPTAKIPNSAQMGLLGLASLNRLGSPQECKTPTTVVLDLRDSFGEDVDEIEETQATTTTTYSSSSSDTASSSLSIPMPTQPLTQTAEDKPGSGSQLHLSTMNIIDVNLEESEEIEAVEEADANAEQRQAVASAWRERWTNPGNVYSKTATASALKRRETNITSVGRHNASRGVSKQRGQGRKSLVFLDSGGVR